jgi:hypothetical protein
MGPATKELGAAMKAIKATTVEHAGNCAQPSLIGGRRRGGGLSVPATGNYIFDQHNTYMLVNDRSALGFKADLRTGTDLSQLEIVLAPPHIRDIT